MAESYRASPQGDTMVHKDMDTHADTNEDTTLYLMIDHA